jgi:hypothetical protein
MSTSPLKRDNSKSEKGNNNSNGQQLHRFPADRMRMIAVLTRQPWLIKQQ